jgi:hypothetical protein
MGFNLRLNPFSSNPSRIRETRETMIGQTNAFLNWAMSESRDLPRIPRRRVDQGGFQELLRHPGARALVRHWWERVLSNDDSSP